jgi:hypothetical protein
MAVQFCNTPVESRKTLPQRFERKFYVRSEKVALAHGVLRQCCFQDRDYPSEQINSLYFDTTDLDQYERSRAGDFYKDKVRIRWYGAGVAPEGVQAVYIEVKSRSGFAGMKQRLRLMLPAGALTPGNMAKGILPRPVLMQELARFGYFPPGILYPVILISYWRHRFCDGITGQRVSLDCNIRSTMTMPEPGNGEKDLELPGGVIEIKGDSLELPPTLMPARILDTDWTRFSKYSTCLDAHSDKPGTTGRLSPSGRIYDF